MDPPCQQRACYGADRPRADHRVAKPAEVWWLRGDGGARTGRAVEQPCVDEGAAARQPAQAGPPRGRPVPAHSRSSVFARRRLQSWPSGLVRNSRLPAAVTSSDGAYAPEVASMGDMTRHRDNADLRRDPARFKLDPDRVGVLPGVVQL